MMPYGITGLERVKHYATARPHYYYYYYYYY